MLETAGPQPWAHEVSFVEHHRHDRIVVRGTFAGRYVDVDERGDVIGKRTGEGALTGAVVGALFGPPGFAVGLVAGGAAGGVSVADRAPHLHDAFLDEVRAEVPAKSSALLLLAAPEHVEAMIAALDGHDARLVRHLTRLSRLLTDALLGLPWVADGVERMLETLLIGGAAGTTVAAEFVIPLLVLCAGAALLGLLVLRVGLEVVTALVYVLGGLALGASVTGLGRCGPGQATPGAALFERDRQDSAVREAGLAAETATEPVDQHDEAVRDLVALAQALLHALQFGGGSEHLHARWERLAAQLAVRAA